MIKAITFDCAGTLVKVDRRLPELLWMATETLGLRMSSEEGQLFGALEQARLGRFHEANLTRSPEVVRAFFLTLTADWLKRIDRDPAWSEPLFEAYFRLAFESPSQMFSLFEDTLPCLAGLRRKGVRMAVISNWDVTLHRTLEMFSLHSFFEFALASLEEGVEKPGPRLFQIALEKLGLPPDQVAHVGDNPVDDVEGAQRVGMQPVLIDRSGATGDAIRSLSELEGVLWSG